MPNACAAVSEAGPRQLVADNLRLAYKVARLFTRRALALGLDEDDLRQEAAIGLMRAAAAFDPAKGCAFSTLAYRVVRHHLLRVLETRRYRSLPGLPTDAEGVAVEPPDAFGEVPDSAAEEHDQRSLLHRLLRTLPRRDRDVLTLRHFEGLTLAKVARRLGICRERVRQIENRALQRLRRTAGQEEVVEAGSPVGPG